MRTFQQHVNIPPKSSLTRWMVLDGALLPELAKNIATIGLKTGLALEYISLFIGTRWETVSDVGPYLVPWSLEIEEWAHKNAPYRYGVIFDSEAKFEEIELHWQRLITCQQVGMEGALNRLYDPVILNYLLRVAADSRLDYWLGPMEKLWLPDCFSEQYWQVERVSKSAKTSEKTKFNDQEWQSLCDASLAYAAWRFVQHVEDYFPDEARHSRQDTHQFILNHLYDLKKFGPVNEQSALHYLNIVCRLGNVLDKSALYPQIVKHLNDSSIPLYQRLVQLNQLSMHIARNQRHLVESR